MNSPKDNKKTKKQLIQELENSRNKIKELEYSLKLNNYLPNKWCDDSCISSFCEMIFDYLHDAIAATDKNDVIIFINDTLNKILNKDSKTILGSNLINSSVDENYVDDILPHYIKAKETLNPVYYNDVYVRSSSGKDFYISGVFVPIISNSQYNGMLCVGKDVTKQYITETMLHETKEILSKSFNNDLVSICITRFEDKRILLVNPGFEKLTGFVNDDLVGNTLFEMGFFDEERLNNMFFEFSNRKSDFYEYLITNKQGIKRAVIFSIETVLINKEACLFFVLLDITQRKNIEDNIQKGDAILKVVSSFAEQFLITTNIENAIHFTLKELGQTLKVSRAYIIKIEKKKQTEYIADKIYEWNSPEIINQKNVGNFNKLSLVDIILKEWWTDFNNNKVKYGLTKNLSGNTLDYYSKRDILSYIFMPIFVKSEFWGLIGFDDCFNERTWLDAEIDTLKIAADILGASLENKNSREKIENNEAQLNALIENRDDLICSYDSHKKLVIFNNAFEEFFKKLSGRNVKSGINVLSFFKYKKSRDFWSDMFQRSLNGEHLSFEFDLEDINGNISYWETSLNPIVKENEVIGFSQIMNNIDERKHSHQELKESEQKLRELNVSKDKFFSIIAHDIKNPFSIFMNTTEQLYKMHSDLSKEDIIEYIHAMYNSARRLNSLLENLLTWTRTQRDNINFNPENIDISYIVNNNISLLQYNADSKKIKIQSKINPDFNCYADTNMVSTIIRNLLNNAIKFTPEGGKITINAEIYKNNNGSNAQMLKIGISDTGVGISDDDLPKLFNIDTPISTLGTAYEKGTGLGLVLCKEFVEKHGGKIWAESIVGNGTTFYFTLPVSE